MRLPHLTFCQASIENIINTQTVACADWNGCFLFGWFCRGCFMHWNNNFHVKHAHRHSVLKVYFEQSETEKCLDKIDIYECCHLCEMLLHSQLQPLSSNVCILYVNDQKTENLQIGFYLNRIILNWIRTFVWKKSIEKSFVYNNFLAF